MTKISNIAAAVVAAGLSFAAAPSFAADAGDMLTARLTQKLEAKSTEAFMDTWVAVRNYSLAQKLEAKSPVTYAFIGNRVLPVYTGVTKTRSI